MVQKGTAGKRRKKRGSGSGVPAWVLPTGIGIGVLALILAVAVLIPWGAVPLPGGQPTSDSCFSEYVDAWRDYEQARSKAQDVESANKAVPGMRSGLERITAAAENWSKLLGEHPLPAKEAFPWRVKVQDELDKIRREFPSNREFWAGSEGFVIEAEQLSDLLKTQRTAVNSLMQTALAGDQGFDEAARMQPTPPPSPSASAQPPSDSTGEPAMPAAGGSKATAPTDTSPSDTSGPPNVPPPAVEIPKTAVHEELGDKVVNIRLLGLDSPVQSFPLLPRFTSLTGAAAPKNGGSHANGADFVFVGPVEDIEAFAKHLDSFGKVIQVDPASRLIVLWISPETKAALPSRRFP